MTGKAYIAEHETAKREQDFAERAWLEYFNHYLYTSGLISDREYRRMVEKISQRCTSKNRSKRSH